jgi:lysyl-tRNA synthetase, class II
MLEDHEQIVVRRRKLADLRARGLPAYPNDFRPDHTTADVLARFGVLDEAGLKEAGPVRVAGRVVAQRDFGKAAFLKVQDRAGQVQVYVKRDRIGVDAFEVYRLLDVGDIVGVVGVPFRTRTGELTIEATEFRCLNKAVRGLPEKWHGLKDVETRFRQRYVDLIVNPDARRVFEVRSAVIGAIRRTLTERGFLEVETPMMQAIPGGAAARPFATHHNALGIDLFMRIAPELYLKRLLVGGFERVFELGRMFRNEGLSTRHNPEFTMVEFYQAYATYEDLMDFTETMLRGVAQEVLGTTQVAWGDHAIDLGPAWRRATMADLVAEHVDAPAARLLDPEVIRPLVERTGGIERPTMTPGELLGVLFERLVEPQLIQPTFVCQYPVELSPLARRNDADPRFVDRFELFIGRHEMANAFSELNDPDDQRQRFEAQLAGGGVGGGEAHAMEDK